MRSREHLVVALPRPRSAAGGAHPGLTTHPPATPASAAMCRRRWSTRRAWTSRQAAPTSSLIAGAETFRTRTRLRNRGSQAGLDERRTSRCRSQTAPTTRHADGRACGDSASTWTAPAYVYPMFEQALRIDAGESSDDHRRRIGELWSQFSAVAADNPYAWSRKPLSAEEIWQPSADNRMISWPYTKLMNSNNMVDQGAAIILASAEKATHLQIPTERWVFPYAGTDAHDTYAISERAAAAPITGDQDRGSAGARTRRCRRRRHRPRRPLLLLPVGGPGGRHRTGPCRSAIRGR